MAIVDRSVYWQQLNRGHPELDQVVDHRRRGEPGERAALHRINIWVLDRDATHMQLENDRLFPRGLRTGIGQIGVPDLVGVFLESKPQLLAIARAIEQA